MLTKPKLSMARKAARVTKPGQDSLADKAYEQIRNEILQGRLAMGDVLSRRRLAERLRMSFLPITEALQRLETEGLVESRPRIGTRVRIPTRQDVLDSYILREALETQAARLCCERMTPDNREQLLRRAQHLDRLFTASASDKEDSGFLFSVHTYHMEFHMRVAELAGSPGLLRAIEREQVLIFNWLFDTAAQQKPLPANFHRDLALALCSEDPAKADVAMRSHIGYGMNHIADNLAAIEVSRGWRLKRTS